NHFPFLMETALGLVIGVAVGQRGRLDRLLIYLSLAVLICAAVALSCSRGGLLAITVQIVFAGLLFLKSKASRARNRVGQRWARWGRSLATTTVIVGALLIIIVTSVVWLGGDQLATGVE